MKMTTDSGSRQRVRCAVAVVVMTMVGAGAQAATIFWDTDSSFYPDPGTVDLMTADTSIASSHDGATDSFAQTFQPASAFDLQTIYFKYRHGGTLGMEIFPVADVLASNLVASGASIWSDSVNLPDAGQNTSVYVAISLDSAVTLNPGFISSGYALKIDTSAAGSANGEFRIFRTGSSGGDPYPGGTAYENDFHKWFSSPEPDGSTRDLALALDSVLIPEPSALALVLIGAVALATRGSRAKRG